MPHRDRILIVDDNVATRYAVRRVLEHHGFRVDEAGMGQDGLDAVAVNDFAALVLDVNLPDMSGFDVVRELRSQPRTALLPVVHVSAASISTGDMITGLDAGCAWACADCAAAGRGAAASVARAASSANSSRVALPATSARNTRATLQFSAPVATRSSESPAATSPVSITRKYQPLRPLAMIRATMPLWPEAAGLVICQCWEV